MSIQTILINVFGHTNLGDGALVDTCSRICSESNCSLSFGVAMYPGIEAEYFEFPWYKRLLTKPSSGFFKNLIHISRTIAIITLDYFNCPFSLMSILLTSYEQDILLKARGSLIISCPGGYLEDSNYSYIINVANILLFSRVSKHFVLAPMSIGPIKSKIGKFLIGNMLNKCDKIFCRERYSISFVSQCIGLKHLHKVEYSGDIAFLYSTPNQNSSLRLFEQNPYTLMPTCAHKRSIGITIVAWSFSGHPEAERLSKMYKLNIRRLLSYLILELKCHVTIVNQVQSDIPFSREVCSNFSDITIREDKRNVKEHLNLISSFDFFIGSRFHSCIFSMLSNTPFICLSYLPKCSQMMKDLDLEPLMLDLYCLESSDQVTDLVKKYIDDPDLSLLISSAVFKYQNKCTSFGTYLSKLEL